MKNIQDLDLNREQRQFVSWAINRWFIDCPIRVDEKSYAYLTMSIESVLELLELHFDDMTSTGKTTYAEIVDKAKEVLGKLHIRFLDSIEKLEEAGFKGPDACLRISLFEYGIAHAIIDDEHVFIYGIKFGLNEFGCSEYVAFDRVTYALDTKAREEWDWAAFDEFNPFDTLPFEQQVFSLFSYHGFENIFGESYWEGFSIKED